MSAPQPVRSRKTTTYPTQARNWQALLCMPHILSDDNLPNLRTARRSNCGDHPCAPAHFVNTAQILRNTEGHESPTAFGAAAQPSTPDSGIYKKNASLRNEMKTRNLVHGFSPQSNGMSEQFVRLMETDGRRRMLFTASFDSRFWPWTIENAAEVRR